MVGDGTNKAGDPTGEGDGKFLLDNAALQRNTDGILKVFQTFMSFLTEEEDTPAPNNDWFSSLQ